MNKQTHKNGQQNLMSKNFIQISVSLYLKAKRVPFSASRSCLAEKMAKFKMSIQLNLNTFYKHFSKTNDNTKKKSNTN